MLLEQLVHTSAAVRKTRSRLKKTAHLGECLAAMAADEVAIGAQYLAGVVPQGKIGVGYAAVSKVRDASPAATASLSIADVDRAFDEMAGLSGPGSNKARAARLRELFSAATDEEQGFLAGLILGAHRQGASEGVMVEAIAKASEIEAAEVRRALMVCGELGSVTEAAFGGGADRLAEFRIELFRPVLPMLAQPAETIDAVFERMDRAAFELKLDGARIQVHKFGDSVRVYSRRLNEVTAAVPEIVEIVRELPARRLILDGETIAMRSDGAPLPFQETMKRFGRRADVAQMRARTPLSGFFFDVLLIDDDSMVERNLDERIAAMEQLLPESIRVPRLVTSDPVEAEAFWDRALAGKHEGVMAKSLDTTYDAGGRGYGWLKLKPAHTLDLVVIAAEWGSGRRKGWLSNLHLGARDPAGGFVMLGKTFKGLTDALLTWQTEQLLAREVSRDEWTVYVRPELVVEIAFNDVLESPHYPGGMALRFARVKRYRADKQADAADTIGMVREIFEAARQ